MAITGSQFPVSDGTKRPFRLWDTKARRALRWRCYKHQARASIGALIEAKESKVGVTIEVFDARNGKLIGQYTRRVNNVHFTEVSS